MYISVMILYSILFFLKKKDIAKVNFNYTKAKDFTYYN